MAADLHDGPVQQVVNLALRLDMLGNMLPSEAETTRQEVAALRQLARDVVQDMRRFMFELRPAALEGFSLVPVLRQYVQDFREQHRVPVELRLQDADWQLSQHVQVNLFRIIQEALTNVRKHANTATLVELSLERTADAVLVGIADNGPGFDVLTTRRRAQEEKRMGLAGMQDRAYALGGTVRVESSSRGTRVSVVLPIGGNEGAANDGSDSRSDRR
ncbi:MAG: sensor histidine kinase [Armatimonadetes bacterium]|nr:sensor histidine kinase [Armatimonadota bacterium]